MSDTVDATAEEIGTDIVPQDDQPPANLFHTSDPVEVLDRAARVAEALKGVLTQQRLVSNIKGREHVRVEGWTTLGSMLGVVPVVTWTRPVEGGWEARVEARTLDGRTIGAAEAMCSSKEGKPWNQRPDYALRSMAQTRATSKALRGPLGFVVTLAGYDATPAEEMPRDEQRRAEPEPARTPDIPSDLGEPEPITPDLRAELLDAYQKHGGTVDFIALLDELGVPADTYPDRRVARMTAQQARDAAARLRGAA